MGEVADMSLIRGIDAYAPPPGGVALTIGNFDGVHRGHVRLIEAARRVGAARGGPVVVLTFDPHPLAILAPQRAPALLTTLAERAALLKDAGADVTIALETNPALLSESAEEFLARIVARLRPFAFVEGPTFNFGRGRAGSIETLRQHASRLGYELVVVEELCVAAQPGAAEINSTAIRAAISAGALRDAAAMLGRPYRISGVVVPGDGRGATIGFATANLDGIPHLLPAEGVYAARATVLSGDAPGRIVRPAAVNIGGQPTFGQSRARVEAHLIDFAGDLRAREIALDLFERIRGQIRFDGVEALRAALAADVSRTRTVCAARA